MDDHMTARQNNDGTTKLRAAAVLRVLGMTHLSSGTEFEGRRITLPSGAVYELGAYVLLEDAFWARRVDGAGVSPDDGCSSRKDRSA
jgi:hypothetical protein